MQSNEIVPKDKATLSDSEQKPVVDPPSFLSLADGRRLAYLRRGGKENDNAEAGLLFLGGFKSDMTGTKAGFLDRYARERRLSFLRFDYSGHGASSGDFLRGTIGAWLQDSLDMIDRLTAGPQIVVGSSMGGWLMLLLALARPARVKALIGIAPAPDFTEDLIWAALSPQHRKTLKTEGKVSLASAYGPDPYVIALGLIEEGRRHLLLRRAIPIQCPVRLLHGMQDPDVPFRLSMTLAEKLATNDVVLTLIKDGDHRLSRPQDLARLGATLDEFCQAPASSSAGRPAR